MAYKNSSPFEKIFGKHSTQKQVDLLRGIVLKSTKEKAIFILDPFTGSLTTWIVAVLNGRVIVDIDKEKRYLKLPVKRFENLKEYKIRGTGAGKINCSSVQFFYFNARQNT
jgi:DNA modification methylase